MLQGAGIGSEEKMHDDVAVRRAGDEGWCIDSKLPNITG